MSALNQARAAAREYLYHLTGRGPNPAWRTCFSTDGTDGPTGVAPICEDEEHDPDDDGEVYTCCPEPVIEVNHTPLAEYLATLLNADRGEGR